MAIVVLLLLGATAGFTLRVTARGGGARNAVPSVSHPVDESTADCAACHQVAEDGLPRSHRTYGVPTCLTCHRMAP